ncbi:MAG: GntR family transcriptional regulator [Proteobacteria bacterium]|nr:GntR family transcriptional regulator [Pseudomonadota bacterium]MBU1585807.1 GntR family transcriptional regulator [Pseudomonadota bacterium]MBU2456169.1 GntR family transcriptional regulator [Pseudomonadota bacterium]MBU2627300.1 GntR family transcriptional regulator [Pseudomonadota bacterium]
MKFNINKNLPLSIKNQLKRQIRGMINSGILLPGQSLPSCNDMSGILSINRNTVASIYAELSAEGILTSNRGAGTMVNRGMVTRPTNTLKSLMDKTFIKARNLGFTNEEITEEFFSSMARLPSEKKKRILLVWCNKLTLKEVGQKLESTLNVETRSLLIEDIAKDAELTASCLSDVDLVVTSINYVESILPFARNANVEVAGVILTPVIRVLNNMIGLPKGTTVGFICVNNAAAESTCKSVHLSGQITLNTIWAGADDSKRLKQLFSRCDIIFATHHVYDQVIKLAGKDKNIINVDVSITDTSIAMIRERLELTGNTP